MRYVLLSALIGLLARAGDAQEEKKQVNEEVVKAVRAALVAKTEAERKEMLDDVLQRSDLDWPSVKEGLMQGPYYQKPLVTAYGQKFSLKDFGVQKRGADGKMRGFGLWVPKGYDAKEPRPLLVYLHHGAANPHIGSGGDKAGTAIVKFKKACDEYNVFFLAPYTSKGAEWWTRDGRELVAWAIKQVKWRYSIDENRIGLAGARDGADAVWYFGQEMPGTFSVLMPLTGDPFEIGAMIRPLFLGTLDRMDILMGVPGRTNSTVGVKNAEQYLAGLRQMYGQNMRITASVWPRAQGDVRYLEQVKDQMLAFLLDRKRKPLANEVDVETEKGRPLRALWLQNDGFDEEGPLAPPHRNFKSTLLQWKAPERKAPEKKMGFNPRKRPNWEYGLVVGGPPARGFGVQLAKIIQGDVMLEANGQRLNEIKDLKKVLEKVEWEDEVHVVCAREVKESELERTRKAQERYLKVRAKIKELRAQGKKVPHDIDSMIEEEEDDEAMEEEDDSDDIEIEFGDEDDEPKGDDRPGHGRGQREKTVFFVFERWVKIRRPGGVLIREDFGATIDQSHVLGGVKIGTVYAGSLAARSGLRDGDVIVSIGDTEVKNIHDVMRYLKEVDFKFEKEPKGEHFLEMTVRRINEKGQWGDERGVTCYWEPVLSSRVDGVWNKKENALSVLVHKGSGFTIYFTDELVPPGKEFNLFINGIPYQDLKDPDGAPDYPKDHVGMDGAMADRLYRMRLKRAKVEGWQPDYRLAIEDYLEHRDRELIVGAKRTFDLTKLRRGFLANKKRGTGRHGKKWDKLKRAYEEYRSKGG